MPMGTARSGKRSRQPTPTPRSMHARRVAARTRSTCPRGPTRCLHSLPMGQTGPNTPSATTHSLFTAYLCGIRNPRAPRAEHCRSALQALRDRSRCFERRPGGRGEGDDAACSHLFVATLEPITKGWQRTRVRWLAQRFVHPFGGVSARARCRLRVAVERNLYASVTEEVLNVPQ